MDQKTSFYVKEVAKPSPGDGEVLFKVTASTLNRADILQYLGIPMVNLGQSPEINLCFQWAGHREDIGVLGILRPKDVSTLFT